jgi:hypothetical protein
MMNDSPIQKREHTCTSDIPVLVGEEFYDGFKELIAEKKECGPVTGTLKSVEPMENVILVDTAGKPIPQEKVKLMIDHAKLLRKKFPHMKPDRLKRKVAEHFKVNLI